MWLCVFHSNIGGWCCNTKGILRWKKRKSFSFFKTSRRFWRRAFKYFATGDISKPRNILGFEKRLNQGSFSLHFCLLRLKVYEFIISIPPKHIFRSPSKRWDNSPNIRKIHSIEDCEKVLTEKMRQTLNKKFFFRTT